MWPAGRTLCTTGLEGTARQMEKHKQQSPGTPIHIRTQTNPQTYTDSTQQIAGTKRTAPLALLVKLYKYACGSVMCWFWFCSVYDDDEALNKRDSKDSSSSYTFESIGHRPTNKTIKHPQLRRYTCNVVYDPFFTRKTPISEN